MQEWVDELNHDWESQVGNFKKLAGKSPQVKITPTGGWGARILRQHRKLVHPATTIYRYLGE